jgi:hypothetical protein
VSRRLWLPWAPLRKPPAERRSMHVKDRTRLVPIDLPVDVVVVLEQQERAGQAKRIERALRKR